MSGEGKIDSKKLLVAGAAIAGAVGLAGVLYWLRRKSSDEEDIGVTPIADELRVANPKLQKALSEIRHQFSIPASQLEIMKQEFLREISAGLEKDGSSSMKMIPTFVTKLPTGAENSLIYALDIGGSNLRVIRTNFTGDGQVDQEKVVKKSIPQHIQTGTGTELFDFIAECVAEAIEDDTAKGKKLGFTFSFPVQQTCINRGILIAWTKGFTASDVAGKDVVQLLDEALKRKHVDMEVTALINDTVGTLMARRYQSPTENCLVGLILGTGSNAAYVEKIDNIGKWEGPKDTELMVVNTEWGGFDKGKRCLPYTEYDIQLDSESKNKGEQLYEKMLSGMYLGEIARLIFNKLVHSGLLFSGVNAPCLNKPYAFLTDYMSEIESDSSAELSGVKALLGRINIPQSTLDERRAVREICHLVAARSARLAAMGVAGIVAQMNKHIDGCAIAIDGSVFEHYPGYKFYMEQALVELLGHNKTKLVLTKDGSGNGAAITAAVL